MDTYEILHLDFVTRNFVDIVGSDQICGELKLLNTSKTLDIDENFRQNMNYPLRFLSRDSLKQIKHVSVVFQQQ